MKPEQREQVRSNALYLRDVRPIDPDEISEYVEGQPHPAVVRQVLREQSLDLELVERDDGTFEPISEEPISPTFRGVESFPEQYGRKLEDLLVGEFGVGWPDGESGTQLREMIRRLKEDYFAQNPVEYDYQVALAYAIYHLPDYYAVVQYVLSELAERGLLSRKIRVLDVGAGVGGPALGFHDFYPDDSLVEYHAVEPSDAVDVFAAMMEETRENFHATTHRETAEAFEPEGEYDLVLFANVLSEVDDPEAVAEKYLDYLADDGAMLAIAPADKNASIGLREVERSVSDRTTVYSPTLRLWPGEEPSDRGWSFDVKSELETPAFQRRLDESEGRDESENGGEDNRGDGEFVNVDVQYSHIVLRTDGFRRFEFTADKSRSAKMAEMERHVTERVNLVAVKLSHSLSDGGRNEVFKIGDGSEKVSHFAVLTKETALNRSLQEAEYGNLLSFEEVLVLWNEDEGAYNLVVDEKTVVDRL
ncbi:Methyltransferase domain-containing protein [Haladaptatus litoreus]|uniref:Methyltransferase domain-containing protein n=1 Tax=Haladaptatus litoreus TaxID=553468 RepID=A0A1N6Y8M7_9EURY|nr:class I SAM-dependent methyltransferase [Haladaptatus litoreus]SIR10992.1 Methyltransferase domain-containing protein [Haladaptatus litoreus]